MLISHKIRRFPNSQDALPSACVLMINKPSRRYGRTFFWSSVMKPQSGGQKALASFGASSNPAATLARLCAVAMSWPGSKRAAPAKERAGHVHKHAIRRREHKIPGRHGGARVPFGIDTYVMPAARVAVRRPLASAAQRLQGTGSLRIFHIAAQAAAIVSTRCRKACIAAHATGASVSRRIHTARPAAASRKTRALVVAIAASVLCVPAFSKRKNPKVKVWYQGITPGQDQAAAEAHS